MYACTAGVSTEPKLQPVTGEGLWSANKEDRACFVWTKM